MNFCCGCQAKAVLDIESKNREIEISHSFRRNAIKNMESQSKEKRSKSIQYIALGSLVAFSTTLTGCSKAPSIAQNNQDKDKEETTASGSHFGSHGGGVHVGGGGGSTRTPMAGNGAAKPAFGAVSRGWFGGFRFSGG